MAEIVKAQAYANGEVAFISWDVDGMIPGCIGFDIVRIRIDGSEPPKGLATWVPFEGQSNPDWKPQDTAIWPVQKLSWRDLTLRQHRADLDRRPSGFQVKYSIRPVGFLKPGMEPAPVRQPKTYQGDAKPLGYLGPAKDTNVITITPDVDGIRATFTNGILSGQWLQHALEAQGKKFNADVVRAEIKDPASKLRAYLNGDVIETLTLFLKDARFSAGKILFALYELGDDELSDLIVAQKHRVEVILSNSSKERGGDKWDAGNAPFRQKLKDAGVTVHDRLFNNNHIGHNKFAVWLDAGGVPRAVMTGSTNWTPTGLCGQSNNALLITSDALAKAYAGYWKLLLTDTQSLDMPADPSAAGHGVQGQPLRTADQTPAPAALTTGSVRAWFSPNTSKTTKGTATPPDLKELFALMAGAKQAIFFLAFLPSRAGADSIISAAIAAGKADPKLLVVGAISDVTAMPGYVPPDKESDDPDAQGGVKPYVFDGGHTHIVRATELKDAFGNFQRELLKVGNAVVHDKVVIIDPLSPDCVVATGSHNLGFKASYENDENLVIIKGCRELAKAYAVHALDVYDHYRFRAWQAKAHDEGKPTFDGHIDGDDSWLKPYANGVKGDIGRYFV